MNDLQGWSIKNWNRMTGADKRLSAYHLREVCGIMIKAMTPKERSLIHSISNRMGETPNNNVLVAILATMAAFLRISEAKGLSRKEMIEAITIAAHMVTVSDGRDTWPRH